MDANIRHHCCPYCGFKWVIAGHYTTSSLHQCADGTMRVFPQPAPHITREEEENAQVEPSVRNILNSFKEGQLTLAETAAKLKEVDKDGEV